MKVGTFVSEHLERIGSQTKPSRRISEPYFIEEVAFLPRQLNETDCGLFVLEFIERLICQTSEFTLERSSTKAQQPMLLFSQEDMASKREHLLELFANIKSLAGQTNLQTKLDQLVHEYAKKRRLI